MPGTSWIGTLDSANITSSFCPSGPEGGSDNCGCESLDCVTVPVGQFQETDGILSKDTGASVVKRLCPE